MIHNLFSNTNKSGSIQELLDLIIADRRAINATNLYGSSKAFIVAAIHYCTKRPLMVVTEQIDEAEKMVADLAMFTDDETVRYFPQCEVMSHDENYQPSPEIVGRRVEFLCSGFVSGRIIGVTTARGLIQKVPPPDMFKNSILRFKVGDRVDLESLLKRLVSLGYKREWMVEEVGSFSLRGGILDIYGFRMDNPIRMEFFGDNIESIRNFEILSQRSISRVNEVEILPATEFSEIWVQEIDEVSTGVTLARVPVHSYFSRDTMLLISEPDRVYDAIASLWEEPRFHAGSTEHATTINREHAEETKQYLVPQEVKNFGAQYQRINLFEFHPVKKREHGSTVRFKVKEPEPILRDLSKLRTVLRKNLRTGLHTFITCDNEGQLERLQELLDEDGSQASLLVGSLTQGFVYSELNLAFYTDHEIFKRAQRLRHPRKYKGGAAIESFTSLKSGDYVVHINYGIGKYLGLEKVKISSGEIECLSLAYKGGDQLYVPVDKLSLVEKFVSEDGGAPPELHRLGGTEWGRLRRKTEKAISEMMEDLLELYARRQVAKGYLFSHDTQWQREMESSFLYEDTPDQRKSVEDIKRDMEKAKPMDRLVCGDVGYGKTEVAVRAAFKAVQDGRQVGILCPTTILAQQHYNTFSDRLADYPVKVEMMSRFKTPKEQRQIITGIKSGQVDIVIGTHRLISKDVVFKNLGLIVVDEEHRFGVRQKERLKEIKHDVDVVTLTATPIPRTMHMSLMGLRDISIIDTPPRDRMPIVTIVSEFDRDLITEAIHREMDRGGQVFFVHNRVQSINNVARLVSRLAPEVRIGIAHGQLPERELENVMIRFLRKEIDVLVTTMIIESGLDVPNANTMIINRADRFGLAQLYQLRGRVGRSDQRAYAYLLVPDRKRYSKDAEKRLRVLEEHTDLGSGYRIAMKDLEIRGAGNILGKQQHGFMQAVGFETYCKLVKEAVRKLKGEASEEKPPTEIHVSINAYIPENYIEDEKQKLYIYRRLSQVLRQDELVQILEELKDRYGPLPLECRNLIDFINLKLTATEAGVEQLTIETTDATISFRAEEKVKLTEVERAFQNFKGKVEIESHEPLTLGLSSNSEENLMPQLRESLRTYVGAAREGK